MDGESKITINQSMNQCRAFAFVIVKKKKKRTNITKKKKWSKSRLKKS
jgi:hypothetical protein